MTEIEKAYQDKMTANVRRIAREHAAWSATSARNHLSEIPREAFMELHPSQIDHILDIAISRNCRARNAWEMWKK